MRILTFLLIAGSCNVIESWIEVDTDVIYYDEDFKDCPIYEVYNKCGLNCTKTCKQPNPPCGNGCIEKCECRKGFYRDRWGKCVPYDHCYNDYVLLTAQYLLSYYGCKTQDKKTVVCLRRCHVERIPIFLKSKRCHLRCCPQDLKKYRAHLMKPSCF